MTIGGDLVVQKSRQPNLKAISFKGNGDFLRFLMQVAGRVVAAQFVNVSLPA
jgi:hypothetical protein